MSTKKLISTAAAFFASVAETLKIGASRVEKDVLAAAAWLAQDMTLNKTSFLETWNEGLTPEQLAEPYTQQLRSKLSAVFFSVKPEVMAIVDRYKAGNYVTGINAAYDMARGKAKRQDHGTRTPKESGSEVVLSAKSILSFIPKLTDKAELAAIIDCAQRRLKELNETPAAATPAASRKTA